MTTQVFTDGVTLTAASWFNDVDTATYSGLTGLAGQNTLTATGPTSMTAYASTQVFRFLPVSTNTGTTTLNITANSIALGAKNVFLRGVALAGGEIAAGVPTAVAYDGTQFQLLSPPFAVATQAQQEGGVSTSVVVTPGRQHFHPSAAKMFGSVTSSGVTNTAYNCSIARTTTGTYLVTMSTSLSSTNYSVVPTAGNVTGTGNALACWSGKTTSNFTIVTSVAAFTPAADAAFDFVVYGDLP
jgi:hypothetical protein